MIRVNGIQYAWREGMTIEDLLHDLNDSHHCAVVRINDKYVSRPYFNKTQIPDEAVIFLLPMIAGG